MNVILLNSCAGEDYLADFFISSILCWGKCRIYANYIPPYVYDDYPLPNSLYGRGFTAFCTLPSSLRSRKRIEIIDPEKITSLVKSQPSSYFTIVYSSIWRYHENVEAYAQDNFHGNISSVTVLDGEDHQHLHWCASSPVTYYKRELLSADRNIFPISFRIPASLLPFLSLGKYFIPRKTTLLAPCDPRYRASYIFSTQSQYYKQYASSLFGTTIKKGGWDCMRHYEILANHCVPYFPDIEGKPKRTMADYPMELQLSANSLFESAISQRSALDSQFWRTYKNILTEFLDYFYNNRLTVTYKHMLTNDKPCSR